MSSLEFVDLLPDQIIGSVKTLVAAAVEGRELVSVKTVVNELHARFPTVYFPKRAVEKVVVHEASRLGIAVQFD